MRPISLPIATSFRPFSFPAFRLCLAVLLFLSVPVRGQQLPLMRDVFAAMPDSVLPLVNKYARLICLDLMENHMKAEARNSLDEFVEMEALGPDYLRFRTSSSAVLELKLLPLDTASLVPPVAPDSLSAAPADSIGAVAPCVLCLVATAESGQPGSPQRLEDSNIRFLRPDWSPLSGPLPAFSLPPLEAFIADADSLGLTSSASQPSDTLSADALPAAFGQALRLLSGFHPVRIALSQDALTLTLQPAFLPTDERQAVQPRLRPVVLCWDARSATFR